MSSCININSVEFRALKKRSGLSDFMLDVLISNYQDQHNGRWPLLDEIPGANSESSLKEELGLKKDNSTSIEKLLQNTGTQDLESARIQLNNTYRDLNIDFTKVDDLVIVNIERRPERSQYHAYLKVDVSNVNSPVFIGLSLQTLANNFGIQTNFMTTRELKEAGLLDMVPEGAQASAFIHEGNIYVNKDIASVDAPVHELMHVLMGSLKYTDPELYYNLVQSAREISNYDQIAELYQHRSLSDIDEEVFVEEYSKMLTGQPSEFELLDADIIYQINYNISRTLDTILNGSDTVRGIPVIERFSSTLRQLGQKVNSKNMESKFQGFIDSAHLHRIMGNVRSNLMQEKRLEEICD